MLLMIPNEEKERWYYLAVMEDGILFLELPLFLYNRK